MFSTIAPYCVLKFMKFFSTLHCADHNSFYKEALEESKRIMKNRKGQYFLLLLSFIGWSLASNLLQLSLMSISGIAAIVAGLFVNCWVSAYVNASVAVFYKTVSEDGGEEKARQDWERIMQNMQNGVNFPGNPWNGPDDDDNGDDQDDDDLFE